MPELSVASIRVGPDRTRKDMGDLAELAASIEAIGLLHPVVVTTDHLLVAGLRRLEAFRRLRRTTIPARVVDLDDPLRAERDENTCRKDFAPSELVAIGRLIEEREKKAAEERQRATRARPGDKLRTGETPGRNGAGDSPAPKTQGYSRDRVAASLGVGGQKYEQAKAVVDAAERDPELKPVVEMMDRTGNVHGAFKVVKAVQAREAEAAAEPDPPVRTTPSKPLPTPQEASDGDAGRRWQMILHDLYRLMNSVRDVGGMAALVRRWSPAQRQAAFDELTRISGLMGEWIGQLIREGGAK